jgi:copper chaperone CopZ
MSNLKGQISNVESQDQVSKVKAQMSNLKGQISKVKAQKSNLKVKSQKSNLKSQISKVKYTEGRSNIKSVSRGLFLTRDQIHNSKVKNDSEKRGKSWIRNHLKD